MHGAAVDRERIVGEFALCPLEVHEALAVEDLVDHAGGDEVGGIGGEGKGLRAGWCGIVRGLRVECIQYIGHAFPCVVSGAHGGSHERTSAICARSV
jgi:hypothetical protein